MPAMDLSVLCIPAECDNIKKPYNGEIASRWDASLLCDICRHFASVMLHFASLISHNLRCIPAYTHLIPTGFFQSSLNNHRDNFYIFFYAPTPSAQKKPCPFKKSPNLHSRNAVSTKNCIFLVQFSLFPALFQCNLVYLHKYKWYGQIIQFFQT